MRKRIVSNFFIWLLMDGYHNILTNWYGNDQFRRSSETAMGMIAIYRKAK